MNGSNIFFSLQYLYFLNYKNIVFLLCIFCSKLFRVGDLVMKDLDDIPRSKKQILPVILCGGQGTRLWPLSRKSFPKQFLSISNLNEKSLLQNTQKRLEGIENLIEPILICNREHRFIVAEQMREIKINPNSILLEPFGRNTAPAILLAAFKSLEIEDNPHLLILSADHQIKMKKSLEI